MDKEKNPRQHPTTAVPSGAALLAICGNMQGSVLIGVIVTMVVVASMGVAMVTLTSTSTFTEIGALDAAKAYYLAEAGGRYAEPLIRQEAQGGGNPFHPVLGTIALLNNKTFSFANGDQFRLTLSYVAPTYTLNSYGILRQGGQAFQASQRITFLINATGPDTPITFDTQADLEENLTTLSGDAGIVASTLKIDADQTELALAWDTSATLPDLASNWTSNDGLLSYQLQIKANIAANLNEFLAGLSFRVDEASDSAYGFSFMKRGGRRNAGCGITIPSVFCATDVNGDFIFADKVVYMVLWKKVGGVYTIIDYHQALIGDGVINNRGRLQDWSTLIVQVEERYRTDADGNYLDVNGQITEDPAARVRENVIAAYTQGEDDTDAKSYEYKRQTSNCSCSVDDCSCTVHWDHSKFNGVNWIGNGTGAIIDSSLTSDGFATIRPGEIGIHYLGDTGERFFDDFAMTSGDGSGGGSTVRY